MIVEDGPSPFLCFPNSLCAQSIFGRVVAAGDTAGVTTANLALSDSTGAVVARVQAGESGDFRLPAPGPGRFVVRENMKGVHGMAEEIRVFDPTETTSEPSVEKRGTGGVSQESSPRIERSGFSLARDSKTEDLLPSMARRP